MNFVLLTARFQVWAVDLNPTAVAYAAFNAQRLGVAGRVAAVQGSWYQPLLAAGVGQLAGILSNPPYITSEQMAGLQAEVGRWAPSSCYWPVFGECLCMECGAHGPQLFLY